MEKNVQPDSSELIAIQDLQIKLYNFASDLECCTLEDSSKNVAAVVAGYGAKKLQKKSQCNCKKKLQISLNVLIAKKLLTVSEAKTFEKDLITL